MENSLTSENYSVKTNQASALNFIDASIKATVKVMFKFDNDEPQELMEIIDKLTLELTKNIDNSGNQTASIEFKSKNGKIFTLYLENK